MVSNDSERQVRDVVVTVPKRMGEIPHSIDVWVCPACERAHSHQAGQTASICGCTGWDAAGVRRVRATYVLSAVAVEMVERVQSAARAAVAAGRAAGDRADLSPGAKLRGGQRELTR